MLKRFSTAFRHWHTPEDYIENWYKSEKQPPLALSIGIQTFMFTVKKHAKKKFMW